MGNQAQAKSSNQVYNWKVPVIHTQMSQYDPFWKEEDEKRVLEMEKWYELDNRSDPSHPLHALYTGLNEKYGKRSNSES